MVMIAHPAAAISGIKSSLVECWLYLFTRSCGAELHRKIGFDTIKNAERGSVKEGEGESVDERNVRREMRAMLAEFLVSHSLASLPPSGASSVPTDGLQSYQFIRYERGVFFLHFPESYLFA